jgi:predicted acyl esterase
VAATLAAACSDDPSDVPAAPTTAASPDTTVALDTADTTAENGSTTTEVAGAGGLAELAPASFEVRPGTLQVAITDAEPGTEVTLLRDDTELASGEVDELGSLLFRELDPGDGYLLRTEDEVSEAFAVADPSDHPSRDELADQPLLPEGGYGYLRTRDGTLLSANVVLPGPADEGPYPTVVEYSGYQPSDPDSAQFAEIYTTLGFAYVGVNMRGTGCSGGSFRYFETVQGLDGYDAIEAIAAQPWVRDGRVGMVGISYPGISQLFVAATRPPSLAAITPLSVIADVYRSTLYPGGILNTGFAVPWGESRGEEAEPFGQEWTRERADAGDEQCAENQNLRLQNPDQLAEIEAAAYYVPATGDPLAPATFVDRIEVPVFLAGAWQDEQTGGHFATMLDRFTASPAVYVTLANGVHTEALAPPVFERYVEFLQLYVAGEVPDLTAANVVAPLLAGFAFGVDSVPALANRFEGRSFDEALAEFEGEPRVRVLLEQGGSRDDVPGAPVPNQVLPLEAWPVPDADVTSWYLASDGRLVDEVPQESASDEYVADPDAIAATTYDGGSSEIWRADATYDWPALADGTGVGFATEPFDRTTLIAGSGSLDVWIAADADDTDLEVTISEIRPDGEEVYVQSGWLRASHRTLDERASTELRPVHTHLEADASPLPAGELTPVRVELFPFVHAFREGSRLRVTIDAPGGSRPVWAFDETVSDGETVTVAHGGATPSRLVLAVLADVEVTAPAPACGSLRAQPCRTWVPAANGG